MARGSKNRSPLQKMEADVKFLLAESPIFRINTASATSCTEISLAARAALALTEVCILRKRGKVYHYIPNAPILRKNSPTSKAAKRFEGLVEMTGYPELFYVPEVWDDELTKKWNEKKPVERLYLLDSRNGWIADHMYVLPFALSYHEDKEQPTSPVVKGINTSPITIALNPGVYVIPTAEIRTGEVVVRCSERTLRPRSIEWHPSSDEELAQWEFDGLLATMQHLDGLFAGPYTEDDCYICMFRTLHQCALAAAARANDNHGQPWAELGPESNFSL